MPIAYVQEFTIQGDDRSTTNYDAVAGRLNPEANPPDGLIVHTAGFDEEAGVFRILDVWESQEQAERFMDERLKPLLEEGPRDPANAASPSRESFYELYHVVKL